MLNDGLVSAPEYWTCASCLQHIPFGFEHICTAKTSNYQPQTVFPGQLSLIEVNKKLDKILEDVKAIKEKTDKIKD